MKKQVIAYLHTHWDREWYREYEIFRMRLIRVFDSILGMLDNNRIPSFYFDGQLSALLDYLEIRPEKLQLVKSLIRAKKLFIGPFYCLVDEFLTDRNCFIKNLEIGMKTAIDLGCIDFIGYLSDTFGHSENVPDILREFGIDKCVVWRGCGDFPSEFKWCGMDTVNLVRGYFNDIFAQNLSIEQKADFLKKELDLIAEKSGDYILLPIGADHLGVPDDIQDQILAVNEILKEDYNIQLGSIFEYFKQVSPNFEKFEYNSELRDNSKTFILQGCYSSRLDLKRYNTECSHKLDLANRFVQFCNAQSKYDNLIEYAYKLLLQNQAHDGICGCSTDDVHSENIIRYKKILQIAESVIDELKFETNFDDKTILNLSEETFTGSIEFKTTTTQTGFELINIQKGFDKNLLTDTLKIPITEDYTEIKTYIAHIKDLAPKETNIILPDVDVSKLNVNENLLENGLVSLKILDNKIFINEIPIEIVDFVDLGDSYNHGPKENDTGHICNLLRSRVGLKGQERSSLKLDFETKQDIISLTISLDKNDNFLKFYFDWNNSQKNHLLEVQFSLKNEINEVYSEDMNTLIKRRFDSNYDIRKSLPSEKGIEAKTNTAPMQRGLLIDELENNIGIITKGLTQYEVYKNKLRLPILRATGQISNPKNTARTTPAGPPLETLSSQMLGANKAEFYVFFGNENAFNEVLDKVYNYIIV